MLRSTQIFSAGHWPKSGRRATVTLAHHDRHRRRIRLTADDGTAFLLDLAEATVLRHGDGLKLEEGGYIEVQAAPEPLVEVRAGTPQLLARLAWHLGNRHTDVQIVGERIRIRRDHVLEEMLRGLGARVTPLTAAFDPEATVPHGHAHPHHHAHQEDHPHHHPHAHSHAHDRHHHGSGHER